MFDVFYYGPKPGLFEFEQYASSIEDAASRSRTSHYWYIYGGNDYRDFDFDYVPPPWESHHIHTWPSQWQRTGGVYLANKRTISDRQINFHTSPMVTRSSNRDNWYFPDEVNPSLVDTSWHPDELDPPYVYHFGTEFQQSVGLTYTTPGATEIKFAGPIPGTIPTLEVMDIFFVDRYNETGTARYESLLSKYPRIQKIRYANSMIDTISRCARKSHTNKFWVISSEYDYTDFNFEWHPSPWQIYMTHVFPSQHQKWSDTFLINKWEFARHSEWAKGVEDFPNLNFVSDQQVVKPDNLYTIYYIDHDNPESAFQYEQLKKKHKNLVKVRFVDNYLDVFKRIVSKADTENVWIINSICRYNKFDFTWQPEPWQKEMIHCFPSGTQSRGDTFYINVESFKKQMTDLEILDWFNVINYCDDQMVVRYDIPAHFYKTDDLVTEVKNYDFKTPYVFFTTNIDLRINEYPCLWREKDRVIFTFSKDNSNALIPRDVKQHINEQIYDYPYIQKGYLPLSSTHDCDVVFISNGEPMAEENWQTLKKNHPWAKRSDGVTGREAAYKAAAELSATPWFFAVFAKTEVLPTFKFDFVPDYFQEPKHYIFHSRNPLNGLEYGAMNINLYNKKLVLETDPGLDFTLSKKHTVVPVCASISRFNTDPWITWRSAFRETMKLQLEVDQGAGPEIQYRLKTWCTKAEGENAEYCLQGALDGVEYYKSVSGDYDALKLSFDWAWCQDYYYNKYKNRIWLES